MFSAAEIHDELEALREADIVRGELALEEYDSWRRARQHERYEEARDPRRVECPTPAAVCKRARERKHAKTEAQTHRTIATLIASRRTKRARGLKG